MEYLCHYGIPGMRWGIRRTPAQLGYKTGGDPTKQKIRSMKDEASAAVKRIKAEGRVQKKIDRAQQKADAKVAKAEAKYKGKSTDSKAEKPKSIKDMTDEELRSKIQRIQLETQLKSLTPEQVSKGKKFMQTVGKDVIAPAVKQQMSKFLTKKLGDALGLKDVDALEDLKKEVMGLNLKKQKIELDKYFNQEKSSPKSKSNDTKSDSKPDNNSKDSKKTTQSEPEKGSPGNPFTGTVHGEGTSSRKQNTSRSEPEEVVFTSVNVNQAPQQSNVEIGRRFIAGLLESGD